MLNFIVPLIAGILLGYVLRNKKRVNLSQVTFGTIIVLIFSLGFSIGSSNELLGAMPRVGLNAVVVLMLALLFSVVFVKAARKMVRME
ncbi:MAG: LysO family transporter [Candidatus Bathyarchaeia archaeon]